MIRLKKDHGMRLVRFSLLRVGELYKNGGALYQYLPSSYDGTRHLIRVGYEESLCGDYVWPCEDSHEKGDCSRCAALSASMKRVAGKGHGLRGNIDVSISAKEAAYTSDDYKGVDPIGFAIQSLSYSMGVRTIIPRHLSGRINTCVDTKVVIDRLVETYVTKLVGGGPLKMFVPMAGSHYSTVLGTILDEFQYHLHYMSRVLKGRITYGYLFEQEMHTLNYRHMFSLSNYDGMIIDEVAIATHPDVDEGTLTKSLDTASQTMLYNEF